VSTFVGSSAPATKKLVVTCERLSRSAALAFRARLMVRRDKGFARLSFLVIAGIPFTCCYTWLSVEYQSVYLRSYVAGCWLCSDRVKRVNIDRFASRHRRLLPDQKKYRHWHGDSEHRCLLVSTEIISK